MNAPTSFADFLRQQRDTGYANPPPLQQFLEGCYQQFRIDNSGAVADYIPELKRANPDVAVVIRPDRELPVQKLVALMDALQRAEITRVGIATRAERK